ncbi:5467_t:CDS:2 [Funneliformis mosseae]|uniref:5467_t:CDS:1 n=1 Tax=Funneliformis mosseae TaxID=27381 RepID=A0A9N9D2P3_FUNMO|nr:5467_t:CDS:2 [Funneliformis mosseae]
MNFKENSVFVTEIFLAKNANKNDYYFKQDINNTLVKLANKGELNRCKIPKVQSIKGWISRYSRQASENYGEVSESNKRLKV